MQKIRDIIILMKEVYFNFSNIESKSKEILASLNHRKKLDFEVKKSALIVLDMQEYFLNKNSHAYIPSVEAILPNIKKLIDFFEKQGRPVIFTKHINTEKNAKMMKKWWQEIIEKDDVRGDLLSKNPIIIEKSQYDAFYETNLGNLLDGSEQLVITGIMTHLCCETTIRSAFLRNYEIFFPIDGTATYNEKYHLSSFYNLSHGFCEPVLVEDLIK